MDPFSRATRRRILGGFFFAYSVMRCITPFPRGKSTQILQILQYTTDSLFHLFTDVRVEPLSTKDTKIRSSLSQFSNFGYQSLFQFRY